MPLVSKKMIRNPFMTPNQTNMKVIPTQSHQMGTALMVKNVIPTWQEWMIHRNANFGINQNLSAMILVGLLSLLQMTLILNDLHFNRVKIKLRSLETRNNGTRWTCIFIMKTQVIMHSSNFYFRPKIIVSKTKKSYDQDKIFDECLITWSFAWKKCKIIVSSTIKWFD